MEYRYFSAKINGIDNYRFLKQSRYFSSICAETGSELAIFSQIALKAFYVWARGQKFDKIYCTIRELWLSTHNKEMKEGLQPLAKQAKVFSTAFISCCLFNTSCFLTTAIIDWMKSYSHVNDSTAARHLAYPGWFVN